MTDKTRILITLPKERAILLKHLADESGVSLASLAGICLYIGLRTLQRTTNPDMELITGSKKKEEEYN